MKKLRITIADKVYDVAVEVLDDAAAGPPAVSNPAPVTSASVEAPASALTPASSGGGAGSIASPLAGKVVSIEVNRGAHVEEGQNLIVLEAMKMNTYVTAESAGTVSDIFISAGDAVEEGQPLIAVN
jgi:methylmalonyl-CoA carboxyltransferase small subunit